MVGEGILHIFLSITCSLQTYKCKHFPTAFIIFVLVLLCCYALHMNMETVLRLFGQDPRVAR